MEFNSSRNQGYVFHLKQGQLRIYKNRFYYLERLPSAFYYEFDEPTELKSFLELMQPSCDKGLGADRYLSEAFSFENKVLSFKNKLVLRSISPADQLNRKQIKKFFQAHQVPPWERRFWPVIECANGEVQVLGISKTQSAAQGETGLAVSNFQRLSLMGLL